MASTSTIVDMSRRPFEMTLDIHGIDINDTAVDIVAAKQFPDMLWGSQDGVVFITVVKHTSDPVQEALHIAYQITTTLDVKKIRWHDDFVDYTAIARRTAVGQFETSQDISRVRDWHKNAKHFPNASGSLGVGSNCVPYWRWTDIVTWLNTHFNTNDTEHKERYSNWAGHKELTEQQIAILNGELAKLDSI